MKTTLTTVTLTLFVILTSIAQTFTENGFNFSILSTNPNEVQVTGGSDGNFPLTIPSTATDGNGIVYTVTTIGNSAYRNGTSSVVLPNTITTISFRAFRDNGGLTSVTLPASVTSIGAEAFFGGGLNEVIAQGTVPASISNSSFGTRSNVDLFIPDGFEEDYVNGGWTGFNSVNGEIPIGGTFNVGDLRYRVISKSPNEVEVANRLNGIVDVVIPNSAIEPESGDSYMVTKIGFRAFRNVGINTVVFPNTLEEIDTEAFQNNNLTTVTFPATLTSINARAFRSNPLTEVITQAVAAPTIQTSSIENRGDIALTVPNGSEATYFNSGWTGFFSVNGVPVIGSNFSLDGFNYTINGVSPNTVEITGGTATPDLVLPNTVTKNNITFIVIAIGEDAFRVKNLNSLVLPNALETIAAEAFQNNNLTAVTFPATLTTIDSRAFRGNPLTEVISQAIVPPIIQNSSIENRDVIDLTIPDTTVAAYITATWTGFKTINGRLIVGSTFESGDLRYKITSENPNTAEVTGRVTTQQNIVLPDTAFSAINNEAYAVTSVGNEAFRNLDLTSLVMTNNITLIGISAFRNNQLSSVALSSNLETIKVNAFRDNDIENINFPTSLTTLEDFVFRGNKLTSVNIPAGVSTIEASTFRDNLLTSITIPLNITSIKNDAFAGNLLANVIADNATPATITASSFGTRSNVNLTIIPNQQNIIDDYAAAGWTGFGSINGEFQIGAQFTQGDFRYEVTTVNPNTVKILNRETTVQNIVIPATVTEISTTFNVTIIENNAFQNANITTIILPASIISIGANAFNTITLEEVIALGNVPATIETNSFGEREGISLTIPTSSLIDYENAGWTGFFSINGSDPVIGTQFTVNAIRYEILTLAPNTVSAVGRNGTVPNGDFVFPELISKSGIDFTITTIGNSAFRNQGVQTLSLPSTLTTLAFRAFRDNGLLRSTNIPANVTFIGTEAFFDNGLTEVIAESVNPPTINNGIFNPRNDINLFIPQGTTQAYIDAGWTGFKSIIEQGTLVLEPKVYLQGASLNPNTDEETLMRDDLRVLGLIPTTSPYSDGISCESTVFNETGDNAIVDWVFVELRDATDNTTVLESKSALLQRDGDIVDVNGKSLVQFTSPQGNFAVAIKHRNHLGIMTANVLPLTENRNTIDFTDANNPITFGTNAQTDFGMPTGVLGLWAGNVNDDDTLRFQGSDNDTNGIKDNVLADAGNTSGSNLHSFIGYNNGDADLNGSIRFQGSGNDSNTIKDVVLSHPDNTTATNLFPIIEQLPN